VAVVRALLEAGASRSKKNAVRSSCSTNGTHRCGCLVEFVCAGWKDCMGGGKVSRKGKRGHAIPAMVTV
jgi:hypothetical protein